jgi:hypothetical protein
VASGVGSGAVVLTRCAVVRPMAMGFPRKRQSGVAAELDDSPLRLYLINAI